ncbi:MAG: T9SS type A sorting domain-containing protein [Weeksellaceae bacterium]
MKKFILSKNLIAFTVIFCVTSLSAQQVIVEQSSGISDKVFYKPIINQNDYTQILDENNRKIYVQNQIQEQNATQGNEGTEEVTLSINLIFDENEFEVPSVVLIYDEIGYPYYAYWEGTNPLTIDVPPGTYDLFADFVTPQFHSNIVIKELIDVSASTSVNIDVAEAVNHVSLIINDINGNPLEPGVYNPDIETNSQIVFDRIINFNPNPESNYTNGYWWGEPFENEPIWNFNISDVSNRYSIIQSFFNLLNADDVYYFSKLTTLEGISESINLEINQDDWVFHREKFASSPFSDSSEIYTGFYAQNIFNDFLIGATGFGIGIPFDLEEGFKMYLNNAIDGDAADFLILPAIAHMDTVDPDWGVEFFFTGTVPVVKNNNDVIYSGNSTESGSYTLGNSYYSINSKRKLLPFHPKFSFSASENPDIVIGDNVPLCVTSTGAIQANYIGRFGEKRDIDFFATDFEIKQDGEIIYSGIYLPDFVNTFFEPESGDIEVIYTNNNIIIDGLEGKNITQLLYTRDQEDFMPPTVQHLQFRNADGKVTDRFAPGEEGTLRLAAGDFVFTFNMEDFTFSYNYNEGNEVELLYSPYNQNEWTELELTEYPEHFFMPAFGDYYEASLSSVEATGDNAWYDVKIISTDAAGNQQIQTISPAFQLNSILGTNDLNNNTMLSVYPNPFKDNLYIKIPESTQGVFTLRVTDLNGKTIYSESVKAKEILNWNGSSLPKGIYILSIENNGKVIAEKVIKK